MIQNLVCLFVLFFWGFFFVLFFFRGVGSLSQPKLNIFTVDNMGVMICLGQGSLRSVSASSYLLCSLLTLDFGLSYFIIFYGNSCFPYDECVALKGVCIYKASG